MKDKRPPVDSILLFSLLLIIVVGLVMIASAGVSYAQIRFDDEYFFLKRQILYGLLPGIVLCTFFSLYDYHHLKRWALPLFFGTLISLILVFVPGLGVTAYGASRWIDIKIFSFQPSEVMKLAMIIYLAAWIDKRGRKQIAHLQEGFFPFLGIWGLVGLLILKQPDAGTFGLITLISLSVFFVAGASLKHLFAFFVMGIVGFFALVRSASYRWDRLMVFLNSDLDPQGKGYQISQALLAIGSGGLFGVGLGHSNQKFNYLPEPVTDSIFAVISEELGFVGAMAIIMLYCVLIIRGYKIALKAPDLFGTLLATGITSWVAIQFAVNIAAISGLMPLTGVPLPFVSYGGTSLALLLLAMGILLNISRQTKLN